MNKDYEERLEKHYKKIDREVSKSSKVYVVFASVLLITMFLIGILRNPRENQVSFLIGYVIFPTMIGAILYFLPKNTEWRPTTISFFENLGMEILGAEVFFIIITVSGIFF